MFEVPAGGRRFRAREMLVKQKRLAKVVPMLCGVRERDGTIRPEEVPLAGNIERATPSALPVSLLPKHAGPGHEL